MISCLPTIARGVQQIREGELTAAELVEFCLERIDRHEPSIAAWEWVDREGARREAARLDQRAREGQLSGLLHGIPIGIKDIIDVAGWPTKAGSPTRADHVAIRGDGLDAVAQLFMVEIPQGRRERGRLGFDDAL